MSEPRLTPFAGSACSLQSPDAGPAPTPIAHYLWILRQHGWKIALFMVVCVTASYILSERAKPVYESAVLIDVDRQAPSAVVGQDADHGGGFTGIDQFLSTQIKIIESDSVLRPVAEKYHLLLQEGQINSTSPAAARRLTKAPVTLTNLRVSRPLDTFLLMISYRSRDPQEAADVANAIAQSYLQTALTLRVRSSTELSTFMEEQLDGLKGKMERSGRDLAQFERELNVINPEEKTNIVSTRLLQLNTEYTSAQADRVRKEAIWNSVRSGSIASVEVSGEAASLAQLNQQLNGSEQHFALIRTTYGPTHPEYKKATSEVVELKRQVEEMQRDIAERVRVAYEQSERREQMLQAAVARIKADYDNLNARSFQYQELKRDAEADRNLYEELSKKIKETAINDGFNGHTIRIADYARPAAIPLSPATRMNVALAFLFSGVFSLGAAFARDALDSTVRDPGQVKYLGTDVIGALPAVREVTENTMLAAPPGGQLAPASGRGMKFRTRKSRRYCTLPYYGEAIRTLRSTIILSDRDDRLRSILITSAGSGEGKTTTAVNLAIAHAGQGHRTLIIDADLRRPSVHRRLGIPQDPGLSDVLTAGVPYGETVRQVERIRELYAIPAGPPSHRAADLIGPRIGDLLDEVAREFDLIIIDAPSLLGLSDPLEMAKAADGVLIVAEAGVTRRDALSRVISTLTRVRANVLGIALNRVSPDTSTAYPDAYVEHRRATAV